MLLLVIIYNQKLELIQRLCEEIKKVKQDITSQWYHMFPFQ
jgi:hypothetical protein